MKDLAIYLSLTPEFGGTRFGPFEKLETRLGSDEDRCHIVLPESLGVLSVHAQVIRQGDTNTIVAPADRSATLYLWRQGERRPSQITSPTALRSGDGFSLVTEDGPRFIMEIDVLPPEIQEERERQRRKQTHGRGRLTKEAMGDEAKRQVWSELLTQAPAQMAQRAWTFIASGAIYQPRNIFLGCAILGGWLLGGWMFCGKKDQEKASATWQQSYTDCEVERAVLEKIHETPLAEQTIPQLAFAITKSSQLTSYLETDAELRQLVIDEAKAMWSPSTKSDYEWLLGASGQHFNRFKSWRDRVLTSETMDNDTRVLAVWLASRERIQRTEWQTIPDYQGDMMCLRGPLPLSSLMAAQLGLTTQVDGLFDGPDGDIDDPSEMLEFIRGVHDERGIEPASGLVVDKARSGQDYCVFVEGQDDRTSASALSRSLRSTLGENASGVPPTTSSSGATARIAKFWTSAMPWGDYAGDRGLSFAANKNITKQLSDRDAIKSTWVKNQLAKTIAQSFMLPCIVQIHAPNKMDTILGAVGEGLHHPPEFACVYMVVKVQQ